jgi:hypothetical protein
MADNIKENYLLTYKAELLEAYYKGQETFEKQLSYISGGGLAISIAFIKDIVGELSLTTGKFFLISSWITFSLTLLLNFISHVVSTNTIREQIGKIDEGRFDFDKADSKFNLIKIINIFCISLLIIGIVSIIVFVIINTFKNE